MAKYIVVDLANLFFRCLHNSQGDAYSRSGLALHIIMRSLRKMWREYDADHVVFCLEGKSWRYETYPQYKASRKLKKLLLTEKEAEEDKIYMEALNELSDFLKNHTNTTVLQETRVEGDDFIARWTQLHPDDDHIIVSGDSDFIQLLRHNVIIYDGVRDLYIKTTGVFDGVTGGKLKFTIGSGGKLKVGKPIVAGEEFTPPDEWWKYAMFVKCIRGDSGDGIFSAYPKVRETKIQSAWDDRNEQGYNWNNLMLQTWDKDDTKVRVIDEYNRNKSLIDLSMQPDDVKQLMDDKIVEQCTKERRSNIGIHLLRFCNRNGLIHITKEVKDHSEYLNATYVK